MCKCTPNIRTPYCGKGECVWPHQKKPEGARKSGPFGDEEVAMNALYEAIEECGSYSFLESTPRTSLTVELVDKLRENGFDIVRVEKARQPK